MGPLLLSKILSLKQAFDQDSKKTNPIFDDKNINDIIVSEIFAILGLTDKYSSILNFRERFLWGNILKHPKIIRFITSLDFETNTRWSKYAKYNKSFKSIQFTAKRL